MTRVGFERTAPVFERVKTFHALDCAATVISDQSYGIDTNEKMVNMIRLKIENEAIMVCLKAS
jgi:hypothetical protein